MGKFWKTLDTGTRLALCRFAEGGPMPTTLQIHADDLHRLVHIDPHTREAARKLGLAELEVGKAKEKLFKAITQRLEGDIAADVEVCANAEMAKAFCIAIEKLLQLLPATPNTSANTTVGFGSHTIMAPCVVELAEDIGGDAVFALTPGLEWSGSRGVYFTYSRVGRCLLIYVYPYDGKTARAPKSVRATLFVGRTQAGNLR